MPATLALVGRPNVGKSTLFNRLTRTRDALVADIPGVTRDRRYGRIELGARSATLIDTGGFGGEGELRALIEQQIDYALADTDIAVLVLDAASGPVPGDYALLDRLRRVGCEVLGIANKTDGVDFEGVLGPFSELGLEQEVLPISALLGHGMRRLVSHLESRLPDVEEPPVPGDGIRIAIIGRPNVGKSTLVNRLLGEARQLVSAMPGTTMDAMELPFQQDGTLFRIIDTAGIRRKGRVREALEKFSVVKSLDAINRAEVVLVLLDASEGITNQDLHVMQYALEAGCGVVACLNKWDSVSAECATRVREEVLRRLKFAPYIPVRRLSALRGDNVRAVVSLARDIHHSRTLERSAAEVTDILHRAVSRQPPPVVSGRRVKLRYAHKVESNPPRILIHGGRASALPGHYVKYLERVFREELGILGSGVQLEFRDAANPYAGRANQLNRRQVRKRRRIMQHSRRR